MPFVKNYRRAGALTGQYDEPGDKCFVQYKALMDVWKNENRWRHIDEFARRIWPDDQQRAAALALLVFMHKHGFRYEDAQCAANGDI